MKAAISNAQSREVVLAYHEATQHHFHRYAPGPGGLDWATQPDPFRRYQGAPLTPLELPPEAESPLPVPAPLNPQSVSRLFFYSLAISAWKQAGGSRWALRVNPSSGNLHPTECYLLCPPVAGVDEQAGVYHYAPREHGLELRATLSSPLWTKLTSSLPPQTLFVGLSSVPWREAWKYGERAFRYCHHDLGHALGALRIAAAGLGWQVRLLDDLSAADLNQLLGLSGSQSGGRAGGWRKVEPEYGDVLLAVFPQGGAGASAGIAADAIEAFAGLTWQGQPNRLSQEWVEWPLIAECMAATAKPRTSPCDSPGLTPVTLTRGSGPLYPTSIIRQRRSAVAMDGIAQLGRHTFFSMLLATRAGRPPFDILPWPVHVHLALFVLRVEGLAPGLYFCIRNLSDLEELKSVLRPDFAWTQPSGCPPDLPLFLLKPAEVQEAAATVSCHQDIAGGGCFSLGMIARFEEPLRQRGAWFYPRLFWECGLIGQVLYLEAEQAGLRGTGIGCFFDDGMHQLLGLDSARYQSLYHFTVGGPLEDRRITTLPAYAR